MSKRVLVVDDDRGMVKTLCDLLRLKGYEATPTYSGEEALALFAEAPFDLVLMDIRMPGLNGVETFKRLGRLSPGVKVVLMTAYSAAELVAEAEREGALRVLTKPVNIPELLALLEAETARNRSVLVVDDDPAFLRTLVDLLRSRSYSVEQAASLAGALTRMEASAYSQVVLLDLKLDHVVGREAVLAIRRLGPGVIVILMSGYRRELEAAAAELVPDYVAAVLFKPFQPEELLQLLERLIGDQ